MADSLRPVLAYLRARVRSGAARVRGAVIPNTQAALLATLAYVICRYLMGQPFPVFGAVACYLALGFSRNRQPRRVLEIGLGATFGVFVGELLATTIGFGWWQLLLVLLVTPLWARFIDRSDLMTFQTSINSMVVASMGMMAIGHDLPHSSVGRWLDALVGAGVALVGTVVFPTSITTRPRRNTSEALLRLADALQAVGDTLGREGQGGAARGYLAEARVLLTDGRAAQSSASDIAALNPRLRDERQELAELDRLLELGGRLHTSLTMLARQARSHVAPEPRASALVVEASQALRHLGHAVGHWNKPMLARAEARHLAAELKPHAVARSKSDWRTTALVSLLRAVVVDLLQLTGLSLAQARAELAEVHGVEPDSLALELPREEGSELWGTETFPVWREPRTEDD